MVAGNPTPRAVTIASSFMQPSQEQSRYRATPAMNWRPACTVPRGHTLVVVRYSHPNPLLLRSENSLPQLPLAPNQPIAWHLRLAFAHLWAQPLLVPAL